MLTIKRPSILLRMPPLGTLRRRQEELPRLQNSNQHRETRPETTKERHFRSGDETHDGEQKGEAARWGTVIDIEEIRHA